MSTGLVTGANKGMGLEFCRQLAARGDRVFATCRSASTGLKALPATVFEDVDVTRDADVRRLAGALKDTRLDWLVLNAGVYRPATIGRLDFADMLYEYDVDALGPLRVVQALLPNLGAGSKIALVGSRVGSIADNSSGGNYGYRMAKAALNMAGASLAYDLRPREIAVVILHPGMVETDLLRSAFRARGETIIPDSAITPEKAVRDMLARIDELSLETSGRFVHRNGEELPW